MKIVVNTPSGNIGSVVMNRLLATNADVTMISRHPEKVAQFTEKGAKLVAGSIDQSSVLERAFSGADILFWLTPVTFDKADYLTWARELGTKAATLAQKCGIRRVVLISSIGAQNSEGLGPISCLPHIENAFQKSVPNVTALRPGSFMENLYAQVVPIAEQGSIFSAYPSEKRIPWIATQDIGNCASQLLLDETWHGYQVRELHGPADLNQVEVAQILSKALRRNVRHVEVTPEQAKQQLIAAGMPESFAELLREMYTGLSKGLMEKTMVRNASTTTSTPLLEFFERSLIPAIESHKSATKKAV